MFSARNWLESSKNLLKRIMSNPEEHRIDEILFALGSAHFKQRDRSVLKSLGDYEFKVFSQFGDDGIIEYLVSSIPCDNKTFFEFGVGNYAESNTRMLLQYRNWTGYIIDSSKSNIDKIKQMALFWRHSIIAECSFITKENIAEIIDRVIRSIGPIDLLHIDLDGNDYWILKEIEIRPSIIICEYNSILGSERAISVPYNDQFVRHKAHYSNLYWGASLPAFDHILSQRGYSFIGANTAGNNAYFVRNELLSDQIQSTTIYEGFVESKYRESRDSSGNLTFQMGPNRLDVIRGLDVVNIKTGELETL